MSQEFRFWHRTSPEVAHKVKARSAFIWRTNQGWRISFQDAHLSGCWQGASFSQWTCPQALCVSFKGERAREESADAAYGLISEVTQCLFYHTLCSKLLGLATLKKRRIKLHFLMGGVSNSLWRGFKKTSQVEPVPRWCRCWSLDQTLSRRCSRTTSEILV